MAEKVEEGRRGVVGLEGARAREAAVDAAARDCTPNNLLCVLGEGKNPRTTRDLRADEGEEVIAVVVLGCWRSNARPDGRRDMRLELYTGSAQADTACIYRLGYASGYSSRSARALDFVPRYAEGPLLATVTRLLGGELDWGSNSCL